jgi:hypothetical protein
LNEETDPLENWTCGLSLTALTIIFHAMGVAWMAIVLLKIQLRIEPYSFSLWHGFAILMSLISAVGLLLAALHGIEAGFWAAAYWWLGAIGSPEDAILYSINSMTTLGDSGLTLERHWRIMGALEAADGMLLFGISTAFLFSVMQVYWLKFLTRHHLQ